MTLRELIIKIGASTEDYDRKMVKAAGQLRKFGEDAAAIGSRLTMAISLPIAAVGGYALKSAGDMESLRMGLDAVTKSGTETSRQMERLRDVAKLPGLGFKEAVQGAINMQALGFSFQQSERIMKSFGNALATVGRGREDLDEVIRQLGQLAARGKVTADNLRPIIERVPQAAAIIKKEFGTIDTEVLQKMGVSSQQFIDVLISNLERLPPVTGGVKNAMENMKDALFLASVEMGQSLLPAAQRVTDWATSALGTLSSLARAFNALPQPIKDTTLALIGLAVAAPAVAWISGSFVSNVAKLAEAFTKLGGAAGVLAIALNPITIVGGTLAVLFPRIVEAWDRLKKEWENDPFISALRGHFVSMNDAAAANLERLRPLPPAFALVGGAAKSAGDDVEKLSWKLKGIPFEEMSLAGALLVRQYDALKKSQKDIIEQLAELQSRAQGPTPFAGFSDDVIDLLGSLTAIKPEVKTLSELMAELAQSQIDLAISTRDAYRELTKLPPVLKQVFSDDIANRIKVIKDTWKEQKKEMSEFERDVRRAFDSMARNLARNIVDWKGWKESLIGIAKDLATGFLEIMLKRLLNPLKEQFAKLAGDVAGWLQTGKWGLGSGGGGSKTPSVPSGGGSPSTGGVTGAASGLAGWVGAIGSVATAVSSIVGNFQMHGMNKTLDLLENYTRYIKIWVGEQSDSILETLHQIRNVQSDWFKWYTDVHMTYLQKICAAVEGGASSGGSNAPSRGGNTFNFYGASLPEIMRELKLAGVLP